MVQCHLAEIGEPRRAQTLGAAEVRDPPAWSLSLCHLPAVLLEKCALCSPDLPALEAGLCQLPGKLSHHPHVPAGSCQPALPFLLETFSACFGEEIISKRLQAVLNRELLSPSYSVCCLKVFVSVFCSVRVTG